MAGQEYWKKVKGEWVNTLPKTRGRKKDLDTDKWDTHKEGMGKAKRKPKQHGGRTNLLEELGRVEAEPSNRNRRAEVSRVHRELNRGYAKGGRSGYDSGGAVLKGKKVGIQIK